MKAQIEIQIEKSDDFILHLSLWYKKNKKLKKENMTMQRDIIKLKCKILMRKPRMSVAAKKKKIMKLGGDEQKAQVTDNYEVYQDIQNLHLGGL